MKIRRALLSVSDKTGVAALGRALVEAGAEIVATGKTAEVLKAEGLRVRAIETLSGAPEAFAGRMKTLSFPVCSGILYRRGDEADERDLARLAIEPIDCVVVNFYPFEDTVARPGSTRSQWIEQIDVGGPTLVRAAAKNAPDVLVLTDPEQYGAVIDALKRERAIPAPLAYACAATAWERVLHYDSAIARTIGTHERKSLRYGENPHQRANVEWLSDGPVDWGSRLTDQELSYNNILDATAAYGLISELKEAWPDCVSCVIVKHNNPCGVAVVPKSEPHALQMALVRAWEGDPVSAFGGVVALSDPLDEASARWLSERFIEVLAAPELSASTPGFGELKQKRKKLKAVPIRRLGAMPEESFVAIPGGRLYQTSDLGLEGEEMAAVTKARLRPEQADLARFGILVTRALKSNAIALVREFPSHAGVYQLIGAGQGQPNRIDSLERLAVPRAQGVLQATGGSLADALMVSDAFFPFRDTVDAAHRAGLRAIVQPGGSIKDAESIAACDEHGMAMVFTGRRHFKH